MASSSSYLSEEQLQCSICLDVFTDPVSTPCGHNFCMGCINEYWDNCSQTQCPLCKEIYLQRPELRVNTFISELAAQFRKLAPEKFSSVTELHSETAVSCDVMEEEQRAAERQAEGLVKDLELEKISHIEDHLQLLQIYPTLCSPPHTKNWADVSIHPPLSVETVRRSISKLETLFRKQMEKIPNLRWSAALDVTLDPDSAHPNLILSADGKQVRHGDKRQNLPDNPERFDSCVSVLGKKGFSSGRFYYKVEVRGKTNWDLGVARESINRKGDITETPQNGYWTVCLRNGNEYSACAGPPVLLYLSKKPQNLGVFVDYEEGLVSFYDVENSSHIYSFICQTFSEKLYPYFSPGLNDGGENSAPLIISPAEHHVLQE
uniref:Uncharacterized protein n=1 Tax=Denticeps clupeoides TaxID=299321 RepID=A0AAY4A2L4_9TELE